jgi:thioredoxin-related protein
MLLVSRATEEENRALKQDKGFDFPVLTATTDIFRSFSIPGTPMLVLVDKQGMTRGCGGANQIEQIVQFVNTHTQ